MTTHPVSSKPYDVAIVGTGVVGCAVARSYALAGFRCIVIEKGADILAGASRGNSALLHTGFDAPADSLELKCVQAGYAEYLATHERFNLPILKTGALVVAWTDEDLRKVDDIAAKAHQNGVGDVEVISADEVARREPHIAPSWGAVWVPGESIIDPWSTPLAHLTQAILAGADFVRNTAVIGGRRQGDRWILQTNQGAIEAELVVNCAGLYGDVLERSLLDAADFEIKPRKGQFVVYDKIAFTLLNHIILPVPTERTKGVVVTRTIFGNVLVGPTAEEQESRDDASTDRATLEELMRQGARILPGLAGVPVTATYAGLRPATEQKNYRVKYRAEIGYLALGGIRSTGLTSALGLARYALSLTSHRLPHSTPVSGSDLEWPRMPNLAEHLPRDWAEPDHGEIVCHCEMVTTREIERALTSVVPARDLGGLKRRTRACMGRCQGFYCGADISFLTQPHFPRPLAEPDTGR